MHAKYKLLHIFLSPFFLPSVLFKTYFRMRIVFCPKNSAVSRWSLCPTFLFVFFISWLFSFTKLRGKWHLAFGNVTNGKIVFQLTNNVFTVIKSTKYLFPLKKLWEKMNDLFCKKKKEKGKKMGLKYSVPAERLSPATNYQVLIFT